VMNWLGVGHSWIFHWRQCNVVTIMAMESSIVIHQDVRQFDKNFC
jgi:hypothetical protein